MSIGEERVYASWHIISYWSACSQANLGNDALAVYLELAGCLMCILAHRCSVVSATDRERLAKPMLDLSESRQAGIAARLQQEEFAYFTTVRPDGRPHTVPVCFVWDGATILIFSPPETTKIRNLRQNPQVSLALDSFGRDNTPVVVEGAAALVNEPDINFMMAANVAKYTPLAERAGVTPPAAD